MYNAALAICEIGDDEPNSLEIGTSWVIIYKVICILDSHKDV